MAAAYAQSGANGTNTGTTVSVTLTVTAGNALLGLITWMDATNAITQSMSDSGAGAGNTFVESSVTDQSGFFRGQSFYVNSLVGGSTTFTSTLSSSLADLHQLVIFEVSGAMTNPFDTSNQSNQSGDLTAADSITSGNITPSVTGEYLGCISISPNRSAAVWTPGTNFTSRASTGTFPNSYIIEDRPSYDSISAVAGTASEDQTFCRVCTVVFGLKPVIAAGKSFRIPNLRPSAFTPGLAR